MIKYTLRIQEIRNETKDSITLCFKQPGLRKIKYQAGQYITLIVRINGRKYARPYSFSSAPSVDGFLEVTVKRVPFGVVSNYINDKLNVGDVLEVLEPLGDFIYDVKNIKRPLFLWGVGSGITPLYSIVKELLHTQADTSVHLIYGNKYIDSVIFKDELISLQQKYSNTFFVTNFYSQEDKVEDCNFHHKGRISKEFVSQLLLQSKNQKESMHYICGPNGFKETVQSALVALEVPSTSIFVEEFELVIQPEELVGVVDSIVSVSFQGQLAQFFVGKGKNILNIALDLGLDLPYSCQTGNCSTCKVKLINGQLKMLGLTNDRDDLLKNEFLLCCSYPLTNTISIEA
jgi:ring-1,2-phenylacetyl-CoA epoxidase subunit PaaE